MLVAANTRDINLVAAGNSRGVRLPRELLRKCGISDALVLEELPEGILLRGTSGPKLSLDQTFADMAGAEKDWGDWDGAVDDGLATLKWSMPALSAYGAKAFTWPIWTQRAATRSPKPA